MLNPVSKWHHAVVAAAAAFVPLLVVMGIAGDGQYSERFEAKQIVVTPGSADGIHIHEVVDIDFGNERRHGYIRRVPVDFGQPIDITASSPDAPADVSEQPEFNAVSLQYEIAIRVGDPNVTVTGQHRYELDYTLPEAQVSKGVLALDIIGNQEEFDTGRFEVVVAGMELTDPTCNVGAAGASGGCTLARDGDVYRVVISPLAAGQGITIGGTITNVSSPAAVPTPAIPARRTSHRGLMTAITALLGALVSFGAFGLMRRTGRNVVGGITAADAAFGSGADPGATRLVTDRQLDKMATTEFAAPRGMRPWHGTMLLHEAIDRDTVSAWFSDQIAQGVLQVRGNGEALVAGPQLETAPPVTRERITTLLGADGDVALGSFEPRLQTLWKQVEAEQVVAAKESGWWDRHTPGNPSNPLLPSLVSFGLILLVMFGVAWAFGMRHSFLATVLAAIVLSLVVAVVAYRRLLPRRSATGSAAALQVESFRRFLEASEGKHVDWAWEHGVLREYSAWAVSLGAAAAWGRAIASSAVPPPEVSLNTMPLLMYTHASAFASTYTTPAPASGSSSSGGFSGGFSGGSVGGGGGGGSSGSW